MRPVYVVAAEQTAYGDFADRGLKELFSEAYRSVTKSAGPGFRAERIQAAYIATLSGGGGFQLGQSAPMLTGYVGLPNIPAWRVENACASGGFALAAGVCGVASGTYDLVLVAGVEKMRDLSAERGRYWLGVSGDTEFERLAGLTFAGIYAIMASRYMHDFGLRKEHLAMVAVKNHQNAVNNPKAHMRRAIELEAALSAPMVAEPLGLMDCCPTSDGAACLLIASQEVAAELTDRPVHLAGWGTASDHLAIHDRESITGLRASQLAAAQAYGMAGLGPKDVDFAEVHDCFTIAEVMAYSDLGFCGPGEAPRLLETGATKADGSLPVNVSGGLKAKGHPIGATGIGMACEVFHQLRGTADAPSRQLPSPEVGLFHNVGGSGGTAAVFVCRKGWAT